MRKTKEKYFLKFLIISAGALMFRAPVSAIFQVSTPKVAFAAETDLSGEGQISKPSYMGEETSVIDDSTDNTYGYYTIMGATTVTVEEMVDHFSKQNLEYPSETLGQGGADTIEAFCEILVQEAEAEEVRGEVVFEQAMLETGWLQFQGVCRPQQYNFAGLGATSEEEEGISFPDVRTGLRAQVQHLKAYASSEDLVNECVDERFDLVQRESAPYVEWLGIQENPYGGGWAAGEGYGYKLRSLLAELKGTEYISPTPVPTITETPAA